MMRSEGVAWSVCALAIAAMFVGGTPGFAESMNPEKDRADELGLLMDESRYFSDFAEQGSEKITQTVPWLAVDRNGDVVYFLFESVDRIERYDMASETWLSEIALSETPNAFAVDDSHYYISFDRTLKRFNHDGGEETHVDNSPETITDLAVSDEFIFYRHGYNIVSIGKADLLEKDSQSYLYDVSRLMTANADRFLLSHSTGSPRDVNRFKFDENGEITGKLELPYHGDYPVSWPFHVFPDDGRIVTSDGVIYTTATLVYDNSFGGSFDDMDFYGDLPILRRDDYYVALSDSFGITGELFLKKTILKHCVSGENVFGFYNAASSLDVEKTPLADITPIEAGEPKDPVGLPYTPDEVILGDDGNVYLLSIVNKTIFVWSISSQSYLEGIALAHKPDHMAYSAENNSLYLGYDAGRMTKIELDGSPEEEFLANLPLDCQNLATAGEYIFAVDPAGSWVSHFIYNHEGILIDQEDWNYYSGTFTWSPANGRMYHFRDGTSPNDLLWEIINPDGTIGEQDDSPYHGDITVKPPISLSPDGSVVLLGSGNLYDAITMEYEDSLANDIAAAAWIGSQLYTLQGRTTTEVQKWTPSYGVDKTNVLSGSPMELFVVPEGLLVVHSISGVPTFTNLDVDLEEPVVFKDNWVIQ